MCVQEWGRGGGYVSLKQAVTLGGKGYASLINRLSFLVKGARQTRNGYNNRRKAKEETRKRVRGNNTKTLPSVTR